MRGKQQLEKTLQTIVVLLVLCCTGFGLSESGSVVESSMCVCVCCKTDAHIGSGCATDGRGKEEW